MHTGASRGQKRELGLLEPGDTGSCRMDVNAGTRWGPLQEQQKLLTAEPALQP